MVRKSHLLAAAIGLLTAIAAGQAALAQKPGGILKMHIWDSPPNLSVLDGVNPLATRAMMGVFNNLVMFDQHVKQSSPQSIVPDLATGWSWNEDKTQLTLSLRQGVYGTTAGLLPQRTSSVPGISYLKSRAISCA